jgi:hypothetical protein
MIGITNKILNTALNKGSRILYHVYNKLDCELTKKPFCMWALDMIMAIKIGA